MIEVTLPNLILIPMAFNLLILLTCYVYYAARRTARGVRQRPSRLYRCQRCDHVYADLRDLPLVRCPRCGCFNEAIRR